ncbi:cell division protein FtsL [Sporolactobacillus sp. THM7-7]|nr:cell division protein FtsL [Sporolactobacillus sp. THM7-7]
MNQTQRIPYSPRPEQGKPQTRQEPILVRKRLTKGERWLWLFAGFVVFLLALGIVANQARLYMMSRDLQQLESKYDQQSRQLQQLKSEESTLSSPERIARFAEEELGLKLDIDNIKVLP